MVRWPHRLNEHEFEQTLGDSGGQRRLACCSPWVTKSQTRLSDCTTTLVCEVYLKRPVEKREAPAHQAPPSLGAAIHGVAESDMT